MNGIKRGVKMRRMMKPLYRSYILVLITVVISCACSTSSQKESQRLHQSYKEILSQPGSNYIQLRARVSYLKLKIDNFMERFDDLEVHNQMKGLILGISRIQSKILIEGEDYLQLEEQLKLNQSQAEVDIEISLIMDFIRRYPKTIKRNLLAERIEQLILKKTLSLSRVNNRLFYTNHRLF
jgi:hypothetical protein